MKQILDAPARNSALNHTWPTVVQVVRELFISIWSQEQMLAAFKCMKHFQIGCMLGAGCSRRLGHMAIDQVLIPASDDQLHSIEQREQHSPFSIVCAITLMHFSCVLGNLWQICGSLHDACHRLCGCKDRSVCCQDISSLAQCFAPGQ